MHIYKNGITPATSQDYPINLQMLCTMLFIIIIIIIIIVIIIRVTEASILVTTPSTTAP